MPPQSSKELVYESTMTGFYKLALLPLALEIGLVLYAAHAAATIPQGGDPTLRYMTMGVPVFWAVVLPLFVLVLFLIYNGQKIVINPRGFAMKRGENLVLLPWSTISYKPSKGRKFDKQFSLTTQDRTVVVRSLFYPTSFEEIEEEVAARIKSRDRRDITI